MPVFKLFALMIAPFMSAPTMFVKRLPFNGSFSRAVVWSSSHVSWTTPLCMWTSTIRTSSWFPYKPDFARRTRLLTLKSCFVSP